MIAPEHRVALIAGASGGIGRVIARRLARDGYSLALTYLDEDEHAEAAASAVRADGGRAELFAGVDLADAGATFAMVEAVKEAFGRLDLVVDAAGPWIPLAWISEIDPSKWREVVEVDVIGCFDLLRAAISHLRETEGAIIALSTPAVRRHTNRDLMSSGPKSGVEAIVRGIAAEEGRFGIRANVIAVGLNEAGLHDKLVATGDIDERYMEAVTRNVPLQRAGRPEEVAEAVSFLASGTQAGYITGQTLVVDGGYTA